MPGDFGLDAELKQKQDAKYDQALEREVVQWVEAVTGRRQGPLSVAEWWNDGVVLCELANRIRPGSVARINTMKAPFKKMENIGSFLDACRRFGMAEAQMFSTPDLFEEKNMGVVINSLYNLGGTIQKTVPSYHGPKLGVEGNSGAQTGVGTSVTKSVPTQTGGNHGYTEATHGGANLRDVVPTKVQGAPEQRRSPSSNSPRGSPSDSPGGVPNYQQSGGHHKAAAAAAGFAQQRPAQGRSASPKPKKGVPAAPPVPSQTGGCAGFVTVAPSQTADRGNTYDVEGPKRGPHGGFLRR